MVFSKMLPLLLAFALLTTKVSGQSLTLFDTNLHAEKVTLCDLLTKFVDPKKEFTYKYFSPSFYSISSYENHSAVFGHWSFVIRHDSLNQYGFSSLALPINSGSFNSLNHLADSAISIFTSKYGRPFKETLVKSNTYQTNKKYISGSIHKAMWMIDGQKLKVDFSISGEHNQFSYSLIIKRFKDYYENAKLPPWWDGY